MLKKILHIISYCIAFLIVLMAVAVSLARAFTPLLNQHKSYFETWASHFVKYPIKIDHLKATWKGFEPDLMFQGVSIYQADGKKKLIHIQDLQIDLNVVQSVLKKQIQPSNIGVSGLDLSIQQLPNRNFQINGLTYQGTHQKTQEQLKNGALLGWLLSQPRLTLNDIDLTVKQLNHLPIHLLLEDFNVINLPLQHAIYGSINFEHKHRSNADFALVLKGNLKTPKKLEAYFYTYLKGVHLSDWKTYLKYKKNQINQGNVYGQIWLVWKNQHWDHIQSYLTLRNFVLTANKANEKPLTIPRFTGNLLWQSEQKGWVLSGDRLRLYLDHQHHWEHNKFIFRVDQSAAKPTYKAWVQHLDLSDLQHFLKVLPSQLSDKANYWLHKTHISGILNHTFFSWNGALKFGSLFQNLSFSRDKNIPGVQNLSGQLLFYPDHGELNLNSQNSTLDFGTIFPNPLHPNILQGNINWEKQANGTYEFKGKHLFVADNYMSLYGQMDLLIHPNQFNNPVLNLVAGYELNDSSQTPHYLPIAVMPKNVIDWLNQAFPRGEGGDGTVLIQGPMQEFPFDHHNGTFIVNSELRNTDLHYADNWPLVRHIDGSLIFSGRSMLANIKDADFDSASLKSLQVTIPYMGDAKTNWLHVDTSLDNSAENLLKFIQNSPLKQSIGEELAPLKITGNTSLNLKLDMPLENVNNTKVHGQIIFQDNTFQMPDWNLSLNNLTGNLDFTEHGFSSNGIQADFLGKPINFTFKTIHSPKTKPITRVDFSGHLQLKNLFRYFKISQPKIVSGETDYRAELDLHTAQGDDQQNSFKIFSNLDGIGLDLPNPLNKAASESVPSQIAVYFGEKKPVKAKFSLGKRYSLALLFKKVKKEFEERLELFSANLHFGNNQALIQQTEGLVIDGYLPTLDYQTWQNYLKQSKYDKNSLPLSFRLLNIKLGTVNLDDQQLTNTTFRIQPLEKVWEIALNGPQIQGQFNLSKDYKKLSGTFDHLYLKKSTSSDSSSLKPKNIPDLNLKINRFRYNTEKLNHIQLSTETNGNTLYLRSLKLLSSTLNGTLTGAWEKTGQANYSNLSGSVRSSDLINLFKMLGIHSSLRGSTGTADLQLNWPAPIYRPNFNRLSGSIKVHLEKGTIVNLGQSTNTKLDLGRILNLLNINNLIFFNFSDLGVKGYSFDKMYGSFRFYNGVMKVKQWYFDGSVAHLDLKGEVNLPQKTQLLDLSVTPYLTSSLPAVATIAGGPIAGAITWAADKLVGKAIGSLMQYHYRVTGTFNKPIITELKHTAPIKNA